MTFRDFCRGIGEGVIRKVPTATYEPPRDVGGAAIISHAGSKATISRDKAAWCVTFSRPGGGTSMASLAGEIANEFTAHNVAASIAGFLV